MPYHESILDGARLRTYAMRVARETEVPATFDTVTEVVDDIQVERRFFGLSTREVAVQRTVRRRSELGYWVIESRYWRRTTRSGDREERVRENSEYCLRSDGNLVVRSRR